MRLTLADCGILICLATLALAGCASTPKVGVRSGFDSRKVAKVAVAPVWSSSTFGLDPDEWRSIEALVEGRITTELEQLGFVVMSPEALRDHLERRNAWERFQDVLAFRDGIDRHFEPDLYEREPLEVAALRSLVADGLLDADGLLLAEVVYQSTGECTTDPREHNQFAVVVVPVGTSTPPTPCVVTHFQAKLVDTKTGRTMWHNRSLREVRVVRVTDRDRRANIRAVIDRTLTGEHGVAPFVPSPSAGKAIAEQ